MSFCIHSAGPRDLKGLWDLVPKVASVQRSLRESIHRQSLLASQNSFASLGSGEGKVLFFVLKDLRRGGRVVGSSHLISGYGSRNHKWSSLKRWTPLIPEYGSFHTPCQTLQITESGGQKVLKLKTFTQGLCYLGGLVLHKEYRGHPQQLARLISFIRLLFMALSPKDFSGPVYTEVSPFLDERGQNAFHRHFLSSYLKAHRLPPKDLQEWTQALFQKEVVISHLPSEVQGVLGQTGPAGKKVLHLLKSQNLIFKDLVHPKDGGPCLFQESQIPVIKQAREVFLKPSSPPPAASSPYLAGQMQNGVFKGGLLFGNMVERELFVSRENLQDLSLQPGLPVCVSPFLGLRSTE